MIICFQTHPYPVLLILALDPLNIWDGNRKVILELSSLPSHIPFTPHLSRPLPHWSVTSCLPVQLSLLRQILYLIIDWLVQLLSWVWLFVTLWPATCQASLTSTIFQFAEIHVHGVSDANHLTLCPFFCLQSFPPSGSFPMIQMTKVFGASALASVFPMSIRVYLF